MQEETEGMWQTETQRLQERAEGKWHTGSLYMEVETDDREYVRNLCIVGRAGTRQAAGENPADRIKKDCGAGF